MRHKKFLKIHYQSNYYKTKLYFLASTKDFPKEIAKVTFFETFLFQLDFLESRLDFDIFFFGTAMINYYKILILILN